MENILKQELIKNAVAKLDEPWKNLTVKDVAKDLKKNYKSKSTTLSN